MKGVKSKGLKRLLWSVLGISLAVIIYGLLQLIEPISTATIAKQSQPQFAGRALLVASDADMVATAYADAKLDRVPGIEDALTTVKLPLDPAKPTIAPLRVSNSVMSWPQIVAVSPNGQRAYVAEVRSRPADDIQEFDKIDQMPDGSKVTVVDIANPAQPKVIESVLVGRNPEHLSISPDGKYLAVNLDDPGRELLIVQLQADGRLGTRSYFPMKMDGTRQDNRAAIWHPSGKFLGMTQDRNRRVGFYRIKMIENKIVVEPYGETLTVGNHLSNARFTKDGRFFLVPDLKWSTFPGTLGNLLNPKGEMIAIRFEPKSGKPPKIMSRVEVGLSPEGFALNPENSLIVTVNMRRTYLPNFLPAWRGKPHSSLSLVKFDRISGQLTTIEKEYGFEGLLPEQATFDATGKALAVVIYNYRESTPKTGAVEFWNVTPGNTPKLERTNYKIDVVRGAHDIVLVP